MSMRNKLIKARSYQRPQNRCGSITLFIVAIGSLAIASIFLFGTLLTDVKKSINIRGFTGSPTDQVDIVTELIVEPTMANPLVKSPLEPFSKKNGSYDIHFIHIPKCGGTSMTSILREVACTIDPSRNNDCCTNPGYCDWFENRRCESIRGCTAHNPQRRFIFKPFPSITILRDPVARILSAWFYRGHNPNNDFFHVRPYFKDIWEGRRPKVTFEEYIEMPEYQNIQTRMLGADSFPYRNVTVDTEVYNLAVEAMNNIFFIGIQEEYNLSVEVMLRELRVTLKTKITKERNQQQDPYIKAQHLALKNNKKLIARVRSLNSHDAALYDSAYLRFCTTIKKYPDLYRKMKERSRNQCDLLYNSSLH